MSAHATLKALGDGFGSTSSWSFAAALAAGGALWAVVTVTMLNRLSLQGGSRGKRKAVEVSDDEDGEEVVAGGLVGDMMDGVKKNVVDAADKENDGVDRCVKRRREGKRRAMLVVDPYSSGGVLARKVYDRGYDVVRVLSRSSQLMADQSLPACCRDMEFAATIQDEGDVDATIQRIRDLGMDFVGFLCGAEPGVELFDAISSRWGGHVLANGEELSHARRDKYLMGERVREAGLRAVKQVRAGKWSEVEAFVKGLYPHGTEDVKVILKPVRSSSSEDVYLAESMDEVRSAFFAVHGKANQYGDINDTVLVQEYLSGTEYVVNCVSYNGEHKVVSMWQYDKRAVNGGKFVYFAVNLFESLDGRLEQRMGDYIRGVLEALGVRHGPSHAEVMWLDREDQPCLVEIGCRPHGGDGVHTKLADRCIGYNQVDAMIDLVESRAKFMALPSCPPRLKAHASVVMFKSYESGVLTAYKGLDKVRSLRSFCSMELKVQPGQRIHTTVDYLTNPGWVMLVHEDAAVVRDDAQTIHQMERDGLMYAIADHPVSPRERLAVRLGDAVAC